MTQRPPEQTHSTPPTEQSSGVEKRTSPIDELAADMIRTLEEIQRDPLLHHRLSQRGF
jgi:hypothetical protein